MGRQLSSGQRIWHPKGSLYKLFDDRTLSSLGPSLFDKINFVIVNGAWHWPRPRNRIIQKIQSSMPASLIPHQDSENLITWSISPSDSYSTKHTWEALRNRNPKVHWSSLVWFSKKFPSGGHLYCEQYQLWRLGCPSRT